jgi:hypothetical protein
MCGVFGSRDFRPTLGLQRIDILHALFQVRRVQISVWQSNDDYASRQIVGEIESEHD